MVPADGTERADPSPEAGTHGRGGTSAVGPTPSPSPGAPPPREQRISEVLKVVTQLASLVALVTALLVYFGWRRTAEMAERFGADASIFGLSSQDYVLRSVDIVLLPAVALLLLALLALWGHGRLVASPRTGRVVAAVLRFSWLVPLVVGVPQLLWREPVGVFWLPFWFAIAVFGTWYALALGARVRRRTQAMPLVAVVVLTALAAVAMFWMTERVAWAVGGARAEDIKDDVDRALAAVTVYSDQRLDLAGADLTESVLEDAEAARRFRYDGLFLLDQSGGKHFLLTGDWSPGRGRLIVLPDDSSVRLEFGPGR